MRQVGANDEGEEVEGSVTAQKNQKKLVRDIQARTNWSYVFCHRLISLLDYEVVSTAIDEELEKSGTLGRVGDMLNACANRKERAAKCKATGEPL